MLMNPLDEQQVLSSNSSFVEDPPIAADADAKSAAQVLRAWLIERVAEAVRRRPEEIDAEEPFAVLGVDSLAAFSLAGELAEWRRQDLPATLLWDFPTIDSLVQHLEPGAAAAEQ
jgi:acyl carrier protein